MHLLSHSLTSRRILLPTAMPSIMNGLVVFLLLLIGLRRLIGTRASRYAGRFQV